MNRPPAQPRQSSGPVLPKVKVPEDGLPIPVERWTGDQVSTLACEKCGAARLATEDEIGMSDGLPFCTAPGCTGWMNWAYMEADKCAGCGTLGWFSDSLDHCCSRRCMLQAEYAKEISSE